VIYEIRVYEPEAGKAKAMRDRFKEQVAPRFAQHGIELVGVFEPAADDGKLVYITRFEGGAAWQAARDTACSGRQGDRTARFCCVHESPVGTLPT